MGVINGVLYAVGGEGGAASGMFKTVETYDPSTGVWTTKSPMPVAEQNFGVGVIAEVLYAVRGLVNVTHDLVQAYDPSTDSWTSKAPIPLGGSGLGVAVVNGLVNAVGGSP